jgi:hypothetical protein
VQKVVEKAKSDETPFEKLFRPFHVKATAFLLPQSSFNRVVLDFNLPTEAVSSKVLDDEFARFRKNATCHKGKDFTPSTILNLPNGYVMTSWINSARISAQPISVCKINPGTWVKRSKLGLGDDFTD